MFSDLKERWLDGRRISSISDVECVDGTHPQHIVTFADEKAPKQAIVHDEELKYMVFDNEKDSIEKRGYALSTVTTDMQQKVMDGIRFLNLKYKETKGITDNIEDSIKSFKDRFDRALFGDVNGDYDRYALKISKVLEVIKDAGKEPNYNEWLPLALGFLKFFLEQDMALELAKAAVPTIAPALGDLYNQAFEARMGMSSNELRFRDMLEVVEEYEAAHGAPKEFQAESVEPSPAPAPAPVQEVVA